MPARSEMAADDRDQGGRATAARSRQGADAAAIVAARLRALHAMDTAALQREWRQFFRAPAPPRVTRELLILGVAWKIQEQAFGGLSAATKRRLAELGKSMDETGRVPRLKPGARLVREWHGETHTVLVRDDGFEWQGKSWRSLSAIARAITGGHWSGPRFFALTTRAKARATDGHG
jgi:hypothetical protein